MIYEILFFSKINKTPNKINYPCIIVIKLIVVHYLRIHNMYKIMYIILFL